MFTKHFPSFVALSLVSLACAEDYLTSSRQLQNRYERRSVGGADNYNISIYHINDVHAHLDQFVTAGTDCTDPKKGCYGGYARVKTVIDQTRPTHENSLFLNAGDESQGTLFYTYYGSEKIVDTLNQLGFDAMTLGNHEFDRGDDYVAGFIKNMTFPMVCANIQSGHPGLNTTIVPYTYFDKHDLAVVAVTTADTAFISSPGPTTTFSDPITTIQKTVDDIQAKYSKNTKIVAVTHIGYELDQQLAQQTRGIYLVIGGHSHTLLGDMAGAEGPYPTIEKNLDGEEVFVVTSYKWGEYLGYMDLEFNSQGKIVGFTGGPIHLTNGTAQDPGLQAQIKEWRGPFEVFAAEVIGSADVDLGNDGCKSVECVLGDVMADAMKWYRPNTDFAYLNGGGVRATIPAGDVTRGEVVTAFPFGNAVVELQVKGSDLWKIFEGIYSVRSQFNGNAVVPTGQFSKELRLTYNPSNTNGSRLISLEIGGKPIDFEKVYTVAATDYVAGGGDNQFPKFSPDQFAVLDALDEVLTRYVNATSPINVALDGRASITNQTSPAPTASTSITSDAATITHSSTSSNASATTTTESATTTIGSSTTTSATTNTPSPTATACAASSCPLDLFKEKGTISNQKPGVFFQCAYPRGACSWTVSGGALRNPGQKNCPQVATCV